MDLKPYTAKPLSAFGKERFTMNGHDLSDLFSLIEAKDFTATYDDLTQRKPSLKAAYNRLTKAYKRNPVAKSVLDRFAGLSDNVYIINVSELESHMNSVEKARPQIIEFLKSLADWKWGAFVTGRKGHQSRFESKLGLKNIGQLAGGSPDEEDTEPGTEDIPSTNSVSRTDEVAASTATVPQILKHRFLLRPDYAINLDLPLNMTNAEAIRFAEFIKSLPFN
jgi:hypothetical protein